MGFGLLCIATGLTIVWIVSLIGPSDSGEQRAGATGPSTSHSEIPKQLPAPASSKTRPVEKESKSGESIPPGAQEVTVSKHTDGDTLHVVALSSGAALAVGVDTTVRLLEIDTPESVDPNAPQQCYSARASKRLAELLPLGSRAWALPDRDVLDPYGRTLLYLWTDNGVFVNLTMVEEGQAKAVLYEPNDRYIGQMRAAEQHARQDGTGLWGACDYFGQPVGFLTKPTTAPSGKPIRGVTDPRFDYCYEANDAGFGNYMAGRDPEYAWYDDSDGDGIVCEF